MPNRTVRTSISIDSDLLIPAQERSRDFNRFKDVNLSAYINELLRKDLGIALSATPATRQESPASTPPNPRIKQQKPIRPKN